MISRYRKIIFSSKLRTFAGLLTIISTIAQAQTDHEFIERATRPPACIARMSESAGVSAYSIVREWNSLENQYCDRMTIGLFESALDENKDLPAEKLKTQWSPPQSVVSMGQVDTAGLIDLNLKAQNLWSELVQCHGSAEKARQAYRNLDEKCGLNAKIREYAISVQGFLMTTLPLTQQTAIDFGFHPLFTQLLLENANATSWMPLLDPIDDSGYMKRELTELLVEGHTPEELLKTNDKDRIGWRFSSLKVFNEMGYNISELAVRIYRHINAVKLLHLNNESDCGGLGLWPGASRVVVMDLEHDFSTNKLGISDTIKRYLGACGDFRYTNHTYSGEGRRSFSVTKDFRKLANRFSKK